VEGTECRLMGPLNPAVFRGGGFRSTCEAASGRPGSPDLPPSSPDTEHKTCPDVTSPGAASTQTR